MNSQGWFPLALIGLISLQSTGLSRVYSSITIQKASILQHSAFFMVQLSHLYITTRKTTRSFPCGSAGKESTHNVGDLGSIPGLGRSSGEGKGYPLQYSGMENSMDCTVLGVAKSPTWLSDFHFHYKNHSFDYVDLCQQNDASAFTQDTSIQS